MAKALPQVSFEKGFKIPLNTPWSPQDANDEEAEKPHYIIPPSTELVTSTKHNDMGVNTMRDFPTMYWGTNSPEGVPDWWKPKSEVDVLICGAGPSGLEVAVSLLRQGVSFRIVGMWSRDLPLNYDRRLPRPCTLEFICKTLKGL